MNFCKYRHIVLRKPFRGPRLYYIFVPFIISIIILSNWLYGGIAN